MQNYHKTKNNNDELKNILYLCKNNQNRKLMSKVFRITPKRTKRANGQVLTPDMSITVTTKQHCTTPFYNGAVEIQEQYMRMYQFDYKEACCSVSDFEFEKLD